MTPPDREARPNKPMMSPRRETTGTSARLQEQTIIFKFDIVRLVETFIDRADNLGDTFPSFDIFLAPAHKLSLQGRMSGGLTLKIKKSLAQHYKYLDTQLDNSLCVRFSRVLFATQQDVIMLFTYVHPQNSVWYRYALISRL